MRNARQILPSQINHPARDVKTNHAAELLAHRQHQPPRTATDLQRRELLEVRIGAKPAKRLLNRKQHLTRRREEFFPSLLAAAEGHEEARIKPSPLIPVPSHALCNAVVRCH